MYYNSYYISSNYCYNYFEAIFSVNWYDLMYIFFVVDRFLLIIERQRNAFPVAEKSESSVE